MRSLNSHFFSIAGSFCHFAGRLCSGFLLMAGVLMGLFPSVDARTESFYYTDGNGNDVYFLNVDIHRDPKQANLTWVIGWMAPYTYVARLTGGLTTATGDIGFQWYVTENSRFGVSVGSGYQWYFDADVGP